MPTTRSSNSSNLQRSQIKTCARQKNSEWPFRHPDVFDDTVLLGSREGDGQKKICDDRDRDPVDRDVKAIMSVLAALLTRIETNTLTKRSISFFVPTESARESYLRCVSRKLRTSSPQISVPRTQKLWPSRTLEPTGG